MQITSDTTWHLALPDTFVYLFRDKTVASFLPDTHYITKKHTAQPSCGPQVVPEESKQEHCVHSYTTLHLLLHEVKMVAVNWPLIPGVGSWPGRLCFLCWVLFWVVLPLHLLQATTGFTSTNTVLLFLLLFYMNFYLMPKTTAKDQMVCMLLLPITIANDSL